MEEGGGGGGRWVWLGWGGGMGRKCRQLSLNDNKNFMCILLQLQKFKPHKTPNISVNFNNFQINQM